MYETLVGHDADNLPVAFNDDPVCAPIGVFDSGVGGLSIYQHLSRALPYERYIYYADTLNVPYGNRNRQDIQQFTLSAIAWLIKRGCKLVVIACNSASAYALELARIRDPHVPIVGLVPALKPAVLASKTKRVAVLATKATLDGDLLNQVINDYAKPNNISVIKWCDPQLVPWVESGMPLYSATATRLSEQFTMLHQQGVDHLVLGCTHYPFFKNVLAGQIKQQQMNMSLLDSGEAIASRVQNLLVEHQLSRSESHISLTPALPKLQFYATKYDDRLKALVTRLIDNKEVTFTYPLPSII